MSNTFTTGKTFQTGEQVTAADLNNAVNQAVPLTAVTDDLTLNVVNNKLQLKDGDGTNGVPFTKFKHFDARTILCNATNNVAAPNDLVLGTDQIIKCNDTGTGLLAGKISTNNINSDAVTIAKTDFIGDSTATMTLSGTAPRLILDDTGNSGTSPEVNGNSQDGNLSILAEKTGADITIDADDEVILKHNGTDGLTVAADAGKNEAGTNVAGAKVTGGLYVTGDVYADDQVVADHLLLQGNNPTINFADDNSSANLNPVITGNSDNGNLAILTKESESELTLQCSDNLILETTDTPASDYDPSTNDFVERFRASHNAGKDENGSAVAGAKVTGGLYVTGDIFSDDKLVGDGIIMRGDTPHIIFDQDDVTAPNTSIACGNATASLDMQVQKASGDVIISATDELLFRTCDTVGSDFNSSSNPYRERFKAGKVASLNASGSTDSGAKVTGSVYATGDISADGDVVASLSSDKRLKDNIFPIQDATSKVNKLSGNTFIWNDKSKYSGSDVGVIAQEVQEIIPSAVKETEEGYLKVEYTKIVPLLIESIKELSAKVQELEAKVK